MAMDKAVQDRPAGGRNPDPMPMKDATNNDALHNHGFMVDSAARGQKVLVPYGLDRSTMAGAAKDERETHRGFGGGVTNISHSIKGATANQDGD